MARKLCAAEADITNLVLSSYLRTKKIVYRFFKVSGGWLFLMLVRRFYSSLRFSSLALSVLLLPACGHSLPDFPDFDAAAWRRDLHACQNQRVHLLPSLEKHRAELFGARTNAIDALLGRPDGAELDEQTEKTYFYYIEPGPQCEQGHPRSAANKLLIHFGATGTVTEIRYERLRQ